MTAPDQWTWLARIRCAQGRKGEVFCEILTDFPEKFAERKRLWLVDDPAHPGRNPGGPNLPREAELTAHWLHKGGIVLHFAGVDSISAAEELIGRIVAIPRAERAVLNDDEAYVSDLIGCALVDVAGSQPVAVGEIEGMDRSAGPVPLLIVRAPRTHTPAPASAGARRMGQLEEILIPFAKDYLRKLDLGAKRVEMALPEGLTNLNSLD